MAEAHKHITYVLSEEAYAEAQYRNELVNRFRLGWDKLFGEVKVGLPKTKAWLASQLKQTARSCR